MECIKTCVQIKFEKFYWILLEWYTSVHHIYRPDRNGNGPHGLVHVHWWQRTLILVENGVKHSVASGSFEGCFAESSFEESSLRLFSFSRSKISISIRFCCCCWWSVHANEVWCQQFSIYFFTMGLTMWWLFEIFQFSHRIRSFLFFLFLFFYFHFTEYRPHSWEQLCENSWIISLEFSIFRGFIYAALFTSTRNTRESMLRNQQFKIAFNPLNWREFYQKKKDSVTSLFVFYVFRFLSRNIYKQTHTTTTQNVNALWDATSFFVYGFFSLSIVITNKLLLLAGNLLKFLRRKIQFIPANVTDDSKKCSYIAYENVEVKIKKHTTTAKIYLLTRKKAWKIVCDKRKFARNKEKEEE